MEVSKQERLERKKIHRLNIMKKQASNYRKGMQRQRRQLESTGVPKEQIDESLKDVQDFYNELINNINKLETPNHKLT
jgi:archaellum component FlaC